MVFAPFNRRAHPEGLTIERWAAPDGWDHRAWSWLQPAATRERGSMIFQAGRGDFFEKHIESIAQWHDAGWHVAGFDWRGQSGSGRFLENPRVGHITSFDDWIADLASFAGQWFDKMPGPHVLVGHSMGAHLITRYAIESSLPVDALVLSAPMFRMISKPFPYRVGKGIARLLAKIGFGKVQAWPANERPSLPGSSRQKLLTHDWDRYADEHYWTGEHSELRLGPPSWRWLVEAYASSDALFAPGGLESLALPVMIVGAVEDRLVSADAIREAAARMPDARLFMHDTAAHELLRESDEIRDVVLAEIIDFLDQRVPVAR